MNKRQSGFSLVETLVAFIILVITITVIFQIYTSGTRSTKLSNEYSQATLIAQSQLALFTAGSGHRNGLIDNHFQWTVEESAATLPELMGMEGSYNTVRTYNISVTVTWPSFGSTRSIELNTVRLGL